MAITVLLVDDQPLMRMALRTSLEAESGITVVGEAGHGAEAVRLAERLRPSVVVMDIRIPVLDGIAATRRIVALAGRPPVRVLIMTTFDLDEYLIDSIRAGASGFLLKDAPPEEMLAAVRTVHAGDAVIGASSTRRLLQHIGPMLSTVLPAASTPVASTATPTPSTPSSAPSTPTTPAPSAAMLAELTPREHEVFVLMASGLSNAEIAAHFVVSEATVKTHVGRVLTKTGSRDRVQVVVLAYQLGIVQP
jgi:DNA-binding NarL/FixJ family response regulator